MCPDLRSCGSEPTESCSYEYSSHPFSVARVPRVPVRSQIQTHSYSPTQRSRTGGVLTARRRDHAGPGYPQPDPISATRQSRKPFRRDCANTVPLAVQETQPPT